VPSEEEFADFAAAALPRLLRFGLVLTGDPDAAEDLVQTALGRSLGAWRLHRIDDPQAFVRKVMVNSYASFYRRRGREIATADLPEVRPPQTIPAVSTIATPSGVP
jgi:DNA-directed RNA polymerase specialized sigma24 family protein